MTYRDEKMETSLDAVPVFSKGETVYRSASHKSKLLTGFPFPDDDCKTLGDIWESAFKKYPNRPLLGTRSMDERTGHPGKYAFNTYSDFELIRTKIAAGITALGCTSSQTFGLYSINQPEWVACEAACTRQNIVSVPLYDTLGPDAVEYILNHAECVGVACSKVVLHTLLNVIHRCETVKFVIVYGNENGPPGAIPAKTANGRVTIKTFEEVLILGSAKPVAPVRAHENDVATICYTSGTTGDPKGVVLTHLNLCSNAAGYSYDLNIGIGDIHVSYLPLAHIYERVTFMVCVMGGAAVGFYRGDVLGLLDDVQALKPTIFCSVPRLWNRIYDKVNAGVAEGSPIARMLFAKAYASKKYAFENGKPPNPFWEKLVFSKLKAKLGGRVRYMSSGSAPIGGHVIEFLRICFGAVVFEGYGMTESACVISKTNERDFSTGHVGAPAPCCEIKLDDVPEMNYRKSDKPYPRGEVCVRGPSVFAGYFKSHEQTRECLDEVNGWLKTGDIGMMLPGGRLKIIDRKKNIFKLAQGEYVAPEKIESAYGRSPLVAQSFVYGDSLQASLVAIVVPDEEVLAQYAKANGLMKGGGAPTLRDMCENEAIKRAVFNSMNKAANESKLKGFERAKRIHLHGELFSVENGLMTPTFKLKRPQAKEAFLAVIQAMYESLR